MREDPQNANLLHIGTDASVYVSLDRGARWHSLCADLPTTPVQDLVIHPRENELIIATHGRSLFLLDVAPLQALSEQTRAADLQVFAVKPVKLRWQVEREMPPQPPHGRARIHYWLKQAQPVTIAIHNTDGKLVRTLTAAGLAGLNDVVWDARNNDGKDVPPGVYQIVVAAGSRQLTTSVALKPLGS